MVALNLENLLKSASKTLKSRRLFIVCNTKATSSTVIQGGFNLNSEYFSDDEFEQLISMFNSVGIPMDFFVCEDDFFRHILNSNDIDKSSILVFNSAQSGFGVGRKALVPAFCNLHNLNHVGSNAYVVSLCRHKYHVNKLISQSGISVPKTWLYINGAWLFGERPSLETSIILKPIYESSSIGIDSKSVMIYKPECDKQIFEIEKEQKQPIVAQEFVLGYEVEIPLIRVADDVICLPPVGISIDGKRNLENDILDYERVYFDKYEFYNFSAEDVHRKELSSCAIEVSRLLGMEGLCRVDFRICPNGDYYVTDVSTNPHFITHSSVNYSFDLMELTSNHIVKAILSAAIMKEERNVGISRSKL